MLIPFIFIFYIDCLNDNFVNLLAIKYSISLLFVSKLLCTLSAQRETFKLISRNLHLYNVWFIFSTLLSAERKHSMVIGYFYQRRHETSALPRPPLPFPSLSLSGCQYIRTFSTFAFCDRKVALCNFRSMLWYYSCEITNKKYTSWDMNWNELWLLLTWNRPPPFLPQNVASPNCSLIC